MSHLRVNLNLLPWPFGWGLMVLICQLWCFLPEKIPKTQEDPTGHTCSGWEPKGNLGESLQCLALVTGTLGILLPHLCWLSFARDWQSWCGGVLSLPSMPPSPHLLSSGRCFTEWS